MGKHSAPRRRKRSFWRKNRLAILGISMATVLVVAAVFTVIALSNPYRSVLNDAGVSVEKCKLKKDVLTLTFEGDALGILSCRDALNALRANEKTPDTVEWVLAKDEEEILTGRVESVGYLPLPSSPRVETLDEDLTLLKLKYELAQNGLTAEVKAEPTVGLTGKTVTVTVQTDRESLAKASTPVPAAVEAVNEEGGGIVRCDVLFTEEGGLFAAASYDFAYGDTLLSSAFYGE